MKIAFLSHTSQLAGAEKILVNMVENLKANKNLDIYIFAFGEGSMEGYCKERDINYIKLESNVPWYIYLNDTSEDINSFWEQHLKSFSEIKSHFIELGIELVVINTMTSITGMLVASRLNIPSLLWIHGIIDHKLVPNSSDVLKNICDKLLLYNATKVVVPSKWVKNHYSYFREDIEIIPNFTNIPFGILPYPDSNLNFVFACLNTWDPLKGIDTILYASKVLHEKNINFELRLYGNGALKPKIERFIKEHDLKNKVSLMNREFDLRNVFKNTNALVSASQIESFGMTLIEAMSYGRPIIVSDTSGHKEILEDNNYGLYAEVGDYNKLAHNMEYLINNYEIAKKMGENGYRVAESKFNGEVAANKMLEIIEDINFIENSMDEFTLNNRYQYIKIINSLLEVLFDKNYTNLIPKFEEPMDVIGSPVDHYKIKKPIKYIFSTSIDEMSTISFLIGTHQKEINGRMKLKILSKDMRLLREISNRLEKFKDNSWIVFEFDIIEKIKNKIFYLVIEAEVDEPISIYESKNNLKLWKIYRGTKFHKYSKNIYCKVR